MKHSLLLKVLPFLGVALATTPAWAGNWYWAQLEYNGTSSHSAVSGSNVPKASYPWADGDDSETQGSGTSMLAPGQSQTGSVKGNFILVLHWIPSSSTDPLPPAVGVVVQQTAYGVGARQNLSGGYNGYAGGTPGTITFTTKVTQPDGTTKSDGTHQDSSGLNYKSLAQPAPSLLTLSTQSATKQADGSYYLRYPLPQVEGDFNVTMGSYFDGDSYEGDRTWACVYAWPTYALDPHQLYISSDIEKSWKKFTGSVDKLPDSYKQRDANGAVINQPNGDAVLVYTDPTDATKNIWEIACQRNPDSSIIVESAAYLDRARGYYRGPVDLISNEPGFTVPMRSWSVSGDGKTNSLPYTEKEWYLIGDINALQFPDATEDSDDTKFSKKTTLSVSVYDNIAITPKPTEKASYIVNWHPPAEWESSPRSTIDYWAEVAPEEVTKPEGVAPSGEVNAKWRWKTMKLGELPNAVDYYIDGASEALGEIDDLLGLSGTVDGAIDDKIKTVEDPKTRLFLKLVKKLGKQYAGDLWKQNFQENGQIEDGAHFSTIWDIPSPDNNPLHAPQFVDKDGNPKGKPTAPPGLTPDELSVWKLLQQSRFHLYNPRLLLKMKDELYRGDGYGKRGYTGWDYRAITTYQNQQLVIGDFKENG